MEVKVYSKKSGKSYLTQIDAINVDKIIGKSWWLTKKGYLRTWDSKTQRNVLLHRFLFGDPKTGFMYDHINRNKLDNRKQNLRFCNASQNKCNTDNRSDNSSGYKGVNKKKGHKTNPWVARVQINGKRLHLGYFSTKEKAALAYNKAAIKYHGEFARLNECVFC